MGSIIEGIKGAIELLASFDGEVYEIIGLSMLVSVSAVIIASIIAIPAGIVLGIKTFPMKKIVIRIIYTMMSVPPVIVGLVIFLLISRRGPLGVLGIAYTPIAMVIAQIFLVIPIVTGIVYNSTREKGAEVKALAQTLGANNLQTLVLLIKELRINILTAIVTGYGRAISEVGAVMIVGGNIKGSTRVMTTSIAMLRNMGDYETAIALGVVLLSISFVINMVLYKFQQEA